MKKWLLFICLLSLPALASAQGEWHSFDYNGGWQLPRASAMTDSQGIVYVGVTDFSIGFPFPPRIMSWNDVEWTEFPTGLALLAGVMEALLYDPDLPDPGLWYYLRDLFTDTHYIQYWNGAGWTNAGAGNIKSSSIINMIKGSDGVIYKACLILAPHFADVIQYWDGAQWQTLPSIGAQTINSYALNDIIMHPDTNYLWAAGGDNWPPVGPARGYAKYWNGANWIDTNLHELYGGNLGVVRTFGYDPLNHRLWAAGYKNWEVANPFTAYHDGVEWHDVPIEDVNYFELGFRFNPDTETMFFAAESVSSNKIHLYEYRENPGWVDLAPEDLEGTRLADTAYDPVLHRFYIATFNPNKIWYMENYFGEEEEAKAGLSRCDELRGVVCAPNVQCSTGYFTRVSDTERCCLGQCLDGSDLALKEVSIANPVVTQGDVSAVQVTVANEGSLPAPEFKVALSVVEPVALLGEKSVEGLDANEEITLSFDFDSAAFDGLLELSAQADSQEAVDEIDETNNARRLEIFVEEKEAEAPAGALLDVAVLNVDFSPAAPVVGEPLTVNATILNSGNRPLENVAVGLFVGSVFEPALEEQTIALLAPAESVQVEFTVSTFELQAQEEIIVFADSLRLIAESDEENNMAPADLFLIGEELNVFFSPETEVGLLQSFTVTDANSRAVGGATIEIVLPFKEEVRRQTVVTTPAGTANYLVEEAGVFSFTVSKPGYYSYFGEFEGLPAAEAAREFTFDLYWLIWLLLLVIIIAGVLYYMLVLKKK